MKSNIIKIEEAINRLSRDDKWGDVKKRNQEKTDIKQEVIYLDRENKKEKNDNRSN